MLQTENRHACMFREGIHAFRRPCERQRSGPRPRRKLRVVLEADRARWHLRSFFAHAESRSEEDAQIGSRQKWSDR